MLSLLLLPLLLVAVTASPPTSTDVKYDDLRVKFGWSSALADDEYFYRIPRTARAAEAEGWRRTEPPRAPSPALAQLRLYCPRGRAVCALYDPSGFVAGLQLAIPAEAMEAADGFKPERHLVRWRATALPDEPAHDYWVATQYYVSEESLAAGAGPREGTGAGSTLQDGGVWVTAPSVPSGLIKLPLAEAELARTPYTKQNCIPGMGIHYYHNMSKSLDCSTLVPWFALVKHGRLVGTGLVTFGRVPAPAPSSQQRDWFERPPSNAGELVIPDAPECMGRWGGRLGVVSLHIYYVSEPWSLRCNTGDSVRPGPALGRLQLTADRYTSTLRDNVKKLFS